MIEMSGKKFNRLLVIEKIKDKKPIHWKCKCDCGTIKEVDGNSLRSGNTKSCGCLQIESVKIIKKKPPIDITGKKFNRLLVIEQQGKNNRNEALWKCKCDCGNITIVPGYALRNGGTKSCGCLKLEHIKTIKRRKIDDLIGNRFGRLTVLRYVTKNKFGHLLWECKCDCGNTKILPGSSIKQFTRSCGCLWTESNTKNLEEYKRQYRISLGLNPDDLIVSETTHLRNLCNNSKKIVKERDNETCQLCLSKYIPLFIHHIVPLSQDSTKYKDITNLITLCYSCHLIAHDRCPRKINKQIQILLQKIIQFLF